MLQLCSRYCTYQSGASFPNSCKGMGEKGPQLSSAESRNLTWTSEDPKAASRALWPPKRPPDINSKGRQHLQDQTWQDEHWHEQDRAIIGIEREQMKEITKRKTLAKLSCSFCLEVSEV